MQQRYDVREDGTSPTAGAMIEARQALLDAIEAATDDHGAAIELADEQRPLQRLLASRKKLRPALEAFEEHLDRIERMVAEGAEHGS
jgi:hypothetical protein